MTLAARPRQKPARLRFRVKGSEGVDTGAKDREKGGDQCQRGQHRDEHHDRAAQADRPEHVETGEHQGPEPDRDGATRNGRGQTGRADRAGHRGLPVGARAQLLAESVDDQQGVVDAQAQTNHGGDVQGEHRHGVKPGHETEQRQGNRNGAQTGQDRQGAGHHTAEDQQQQDQRDGSGEALRLSQILLGIGDEVVVDGRKAADEDLGRTVVADATGLPGGGQEVSRLLARFEQQGSGPAIPAQDGSGHHGRAFTRRGPRRQPLQIRLPGRELGLVASVVQMGRIGLEHHGQRRRAPVGELLLQHVCGPRCLGVGLETGRREAAGGGGGKPGHSQHQQQPSGQHVPATPGDEDAPSQGETAGSFHASFYGGSSALPGRTVRLPLLARCYG